eukprot:CAMPEP_0174830364 /NCGR_PEP_ID=MMETSP1114-20130205/2475_1 /TAXON_ID=312471 /ORGANISM="Neobodo designis, Strain CCAP 1951/1" /LENGTH=906 /DNA_ID=CAMNT_0016064159 /DNA_START=289 /DNA_END=3009 /DNA_ORIENTATION=+
MPRTAIVAACALTVILAATTAVHAQRPVRTICSIPAEDLAPAALHVKHTVEFYARTFPNVDFRHRLLGNGAITTRNYVSAWVLEGASNCNAMIGPGFSFLAIAMSPVIDGPWMDFSATSVELSDKNQHPYFSRIIPTDEVGAKAASAAMIRLGWNTISVFCVNDAYGRSVAGGVAADLIREGGGVEVQRCLPATTTRERVEAALDDIAAGSARVVFGAMLPTQQTYRLFIQVAQERRLFERMIFFFSEAMCSLADRTYANLTGSLCATYTMNPTILQPFMQSYWQRDVAAINAELRTMGVTDPELYSNTTDIYAQLAHDATLHVMSGMNAYVAAGSSTDEYLFIRQHISNGGTGRIELDANGDRITADAAIFNAVPGAVEVDVGRVVGGTFSFVTPGQPVYLLGEYHTSDFPASVVATPAAAADSTSTTIVAIVASILGVAVIVVLIALFVTKMTQGKTRDNSAAPKTDGEPFTIVFTDIQSSTALWANAPVETSEAIELHHTIVRAQIAKYKGYEVKTIGDAFMVAFIDPENAMDFALAVQLALYNADWGTDAVDKIYREGLLEKHPDDHPKYVQRDEYDELWYGIRVRIGVHFGLGDIKFDPVSLGYDYYGTVVNTAARVEAVGHGGQICCTQSFVDEYGGIEKLAAKCSTADLGEVQLRGLNAPTHLFQCLPPDLDRRVFPPLRLEVDVDAESDDAFESESYHNSSAASAVSAMFHGDGDHIVESAAYKHAKRFGITGAAGVTFARRCADYHALVSTMLSTSKPQKKAQILLHIAVKWRIPVADEKALASKKAFDEALVAVIAKAVRTVDRQHQQQGHLNPGVLPNGGAFKERRRSSIMKHMITESPSGNVIAVPSLSNTASNTASPRGAATAGEGATTAGQPAAEAFAGSPRDDTSLVAEDV